MQSACLETDPFSDIVVVSTLLGLDIGDFETLAVAVVELTAS